MALSSALQGDEYEDDSGSDADPTAANLSQQQLNSIWHKTLLVRRARLKQSEFTSTEHHHSERCVCEGRKLSKHRPECEGVRGASDALDLRGSIDRCGATTPHIDALHHRAFQMATELGDLAESLQHRQRVQPSVSTPQIQISEKRRPNLDVSTPPRSRAKPLKSSQRESERLGTSDRLAPLRGLSSESHGPIAAPSLWELRLRDTKPEATPDLWDHRLKELHRSRSVDSVARNDVDRSNVLPVNTRITSPMFRAAAAEYPRLYRPTGVASPSNVRVRALPPSLSSFVLPSPRGRSCLSRIESFEPREHASSHEPLRRIGNIRRDPMVSVAGLLECKVMSCTHQQEPHKNKSHTLPLPSTQMRARRRPCKPGHLKSQLLSPSSMERVMPSDPFGLSPFKRQGLGATGRLHLGASELAPGRSGFRNMPQPTTQGMKNALRPPEYLVQMSEMLRNTPHAQ